MRYTSLIALFLILVATSSVNADWWDGITEKVSNSLVDVAGWFKETASPTIREKFNQGKEYIQDPENHKKAREWIAEKAEAASEFAQTEVLPELKKIYEAATSDDATTRRTNDNE